MPGQYYYNTRIYKYIRPHIEPRYATVAGQEHSSNFGSRQYNKIKLIQFK